MTHFLKNVCILGGLLFVLVHGSGPLSIEGSTAGRPVPKSQTKASFPMAALAAETKPAGSAASQGNNQNGTRH